MNGNLLQTSVSDRRQVPSFCQSMTNCMLLAAACGIMVTRYLIQEWNVNYDADKNEWIGKTGIEMFPSFQCVPASEEL